MKSDLLSLLELAGLWGKEYNSIKSMSRRGKFTRMVYLQGDEVARLGLQRSIKAVRNPKGRPYVSIDDPAIPDFVRKKILRKNHDGRALQLPVSVFDRGRAIFPGGTHSSPFSNPLGRSPPRQGH